ncbi:J domain-containing protein [Rhabdaerophilum sp. SD176]|uniref:J domain-containing protein n=1 Tax=Rhabdaerophilum sp. SD176 TaxID=2983548 RepID=UPI0032E7FA38
MMNLNSPLFDRIRSKPNAEEVRAEQEPVCQHPACRRKGEFRAPKGRDHEGEFYLFCLEHVKEYNQSYNYFAGMTDAAVQSYQKDALTGHRPTWNISVTGAGLGAESKVDAATLLRAKLDRLRRAREAAAEARVRPVGKAALKALESLGLDETADKPTVRRRFKELAKRLHPDLNEGDRSREEKLRAIIDAYNYLKTVGLA